MSASRLHKHVSTTRRAITAVTILSLGFGLVPALPATASTPPASTTDPAAAAPPANSVSVPMTQAGYVANKQPNTASNHDFLRINNDLRHDRLKRAYLKFIVKGVPVGATNVTATLSAPALTSSTNRV